MTQKRLTRRPPAIAPPGHVTLAEAASLLGISYSTVYRHLDHTRYKQDASGVITVPRIDLAKIKRAMRKPAPPDKRAVTIRPTPQELERWEAYLVEKHPEPETRPSVGQWLRAIANCWAGGS